MTDPVQQTTTWDRECVICAAKWSEATEGEKCPECESPVQQTAGRLVEVGETSRGYRIYREPNEAGGHRYWSDAIGGGAVIYDTSIASREELELALRIEGEFERGER